MDSFAIQKDEKNTILVQVEELNPTHVNHHLLLRVVHVWTISEWHDRIKIKTLEMVFVDEMGSTIQGSVKSDYVQQFRSILTDGVAIMLSNFQIGNSHGTFRYSDHKYKINFQPDTQVKLIDTYTGPLHHLDFRSFDEIIEHTLKDNQIIDIIGLVVAVGPTIAGFSSTNQANKRRVICLENTESLDRTFRDILKDDRPFGGKVIVFDGDFRQILPVVPGGSRSEIVNASLKSSYIWQFCTVLKLTVNMRLQQGSNRRQQEDIKEFADWLLKVGDGQLSEPNDGEVEIDIPDDLLIKSEQHPLCDIINSVYPDYAVRLYETNYFEDRAILAPTHDIVNLINDTMLTTLPGVKRVYLSSDTICQSDLNPNMSPDLYSSDFLNKIKISGLPNHKLSLKVGTPVMLLRNIDQQQGLCNGTRLQVKRLCEHVIEAVVISGSHVGHITYIPRMKLTSSDKKMPFQFQRRQFPLSVSFAMTINKSQGQSLGNVGLYLPKPVFTHGQLYVAMSRVKSRTGLKVLICDEDGRPTNRTTNVVYKEVLQNL